MRKDLSVHVRGAREDVEKAERVIASALTAAGFIAATDEPRRPALRVIDGGRR